MTVIQRKQRRRRLICKFGHLYSGVTNRGYSVCAVCRRHSQRQIALRQQNRAAGYWWAQ